MNDRYLFKAKRKNWGELPKEEWWIQGCYVKYQPHSHIEEFVYGIAPDYASALYIIEIDETTLCQCTGLRDKAENLIWENDIVYARCNGLSGKGVVKFENGCFVLKDHKRNRTYSLFGDWKFWLDGNIFDNPELL